MRILVNLGASGHRCGLSSESGATILAARDPGARREGQDIVLPSDVVAIVQVRHS